MSWTDDRVDLLKKLWGEGKTAAEIAKELGGVTRNAVITIFSTQMHTQLFQTQTHICTRRIT